MRYEETPNAQRGERLAAEILSGLREHPAAGEVVLGGYFALKQYVDYRTTHDLDAGWKTGKTSLPWRASGA